MNREKNWHELSNEELERVFRTDSAAGLSEKEAARRLAHGENNVWEVKGEGAKRYAARSLFDLTTVLLIITVLACAFFGDSTMALAICLMLAAGRAARIWVYIWAKRVFESNALASLPRAKVVREGNVLTLPSSKIVPGDVIILDSGDTVPCDIRLTAADYIVVSESNVTGIKGTVAKSSAVVEGGADGDAALSARTNMVYAASTVISGFAIGIAVATGDDTLIAAREGRITLESDDDVATVEKLSEWGRACNLCLMGAAFLITFIDIAFGGDSIVEAFLPSIAMAAAGLSEYICAIGAYAWAKKLKGSEECVLSKAAKAEKIANTELLMLRSIAVMQSKKTTLHSYYRNGELTMMGTEDAKTPYSLLRLACYCTGATPEGGIARGSFETRASTQGVLPYHLVRSLWEDNKGGDEGCARYNIVQHLCAGDPNAQGFDSALLCSGNDFYFVITGGVERVLALCSHSDHNGERHRLRDDEIEKICAYAKELRKHGVNLAAIAMRESQYNNLARLSVLQSGLCFQGFIAVSDRPEAGVCESLARMKRAGSRSVIFTENGEEDLCYARAEGVFEQGDLYFSLEESAKLRSLSPEKGRVIMIETPGGTEGVKERLRFMKLCRESELSLTYVGFGIEDMWSMRGADASFAVPTPSGVLPQGIRNRAHGIAQSSGGGLYNILTLMNNCRRALVNIKSILNYLVVSHVARLVLMVLLGAMGLGLPSAATLVFWGVLVDLAVSFAGACSPCSIMDGEEHKLGRLSVSPEGKREILLPTMYGSLLAVLSVAMPFIASGFMSLIGRPCELSDGIIVSVAVCSCIMGMPFVGMEFSGGYGLFSKKSKVGREYLIPLVLAIFGSLMILVLPMAHTAFATTFPGWIMIAFAFLPAVLTVIAMSVARAMNKKV